MKGLLASLACLSCLVLARGSLAADDSPPVAGGVLPRPAAYRRLMQEAGVPAGEAEEVHRSFSDGNHEAATFTDFVVSCPKGRCPNPFLASHGYQCTNEEGYACCLLPSGRYCRPLSLWEGRETPQGWQAGQGSTEAADSESPSDGEQDGSESSSQGSGEGGSSVDGSGGSWRRAAATYFNSYPACCSDDGADQTECHEFSGCQWAGMFKGVRGKQPASWVRERNIVALFEAGRQDEWAERWAGKTLRLKNPNTGETMEAEVLDTCADSDCGGCCSRNAREAGSGVLLDLEYHTAKRFWGGQVVDSATIQWQVV